MLGTAGLSLFPLSSYYARLLPPSRRTVREADLSATGFAFSERHVQCVWFDARHRPATLQTHEGESVTVKDPGRWNLEAGPDFLDAVLEVGPAERTLRGDVELHIRPGDWSHHNHTLNPAYRRLVAHVTYFTGVVPAAVLPPGAIQVALKPALASQPGFAFENIDVTAYPYANPPEDPRPCAELLSCWPVDARLSILDSAGEERLRRKTLRLTDALREREPEQVLFEECLAALGYKQNAQPFRLLARTVGVQAVRSAADSLQAYALLMGVAGLLPSSPSPAWDEASRTFIRQLWDIWWPQQSQWETRIMPLSQWKLAGLRPLNHPVRRLAAAAILFTQQPPLLQRLLDLGLKQPTTAADELGRFLHLSPGPLVEFWGRRQTFAHPFEGPAEALLGAARASTLVTNVLVPFLGALGRDVHPLLDFLHPEQDNGPSRQMATRLFGPDHNPISYRSGLRQQGLLQIFHDFCLNSRAGCAECGLLPGLKRLMPR
jgi:hypothetical protein